MKLKASPSCWDPATYQPLLVHWKISPTSLSKPAVSFLQPLLTPTAKELQKANETISSALAVNLRDASAHEQAAFLLGAFGIRESACDFGDLRPLLCRMTAHLAIARQLRGSEQTTPEGAWALVLHDLHMGRPKEAMAKMKALPEEGAAGRWKRAVTLLITRDWRRATDLPDPSLVETIAHLRAAKIHLGNPALIEVVENSAEIQELPEWSRTLIHHRNSVEEGHIAHQSGIGLELYEMSAIFPIHEKSTPSDIGKLLSPTENGSKEKFAVISKADWAAYFRRHFISTAVSIQQFIVNQWSSPESAKIWEEGIMEFVAQMPEAPLARPFLASDTVGIQQKVEDACQWILNHPETVPVRVWSGLKNPPVTEGSNFPTPNQNPWFQTVSPPETAYNSAYRMYFTGIHGSRWLSTIKALHELDPWNPLICFELAQNTGRSPDSIRAAWGSLLEYSITPLDQLLDSPSLPEAERLPTLRKLADINTNMLLDLGESLVMDRNPEEAIKVYETAFEKASDRVKFSNHSQWMIHYYLSKGDKLSARRIVDHNTEVFSCIGLDSGISFALVEKDYALAAKLAEDTAERYGSEIPRVVVAAANGNAEAAKAIFPSGKVTVSLSDLEAAEARSGQRITKTSDICKANSIRIGDIVLAIDGIRVETYPQYISVLISELNPNVTFIIRRGKKYLEIPAMIPDRRLRCELTTVE